MGWKTVHLQSQSISTSFIIRFVSFWSSWRTGWIPMLRAEGKCFLFTPYSGSQCDLLAGTHIVIIWFGRELGRRFQLFCFHLRHNKQLFVHFLVYIELKNNFTRYAHVLLVHSQLRPDNFSNDFAYHYCHSEPQGSSELNNFPVIILQVLKKT